MRQWFFYVHQPTPCGQALLFCDSSVIRPSLFAANKKHQQMKKIILPFLALVFLIYSCDDDNTNIPLATLTMNITGLEDLGSQASYEGWIIVNNAPVSTGTFSVNANGELSSNNSEVEQTILDQATTFVVTIEPIPDNDPAPSEVKILGGDFSGNSASLSISHTAALGTGFTGVTGGYIIATPTTSSTADELSGVWFVNQGQAGLENLPDLTSLEGWRYEGWAVIKGTPISTGTFETASGMDNGSGFNGTDMAGPPFPGEDFINNAPSGLTFPTDLSGQTIVISIEPVPDNSPAPFTLKPLLGLVPNAPQPMTFYTMNNIAANTYPSGSVVKN